MVARMNKFAPYVSKISKMSRRNLISKPSLFNGEKQETAMKILMHNDFRSTKQCRITKAKEYLFENRLAFSLSKSNPLTAVFNEKYVYNKTLLYQDFS